jgi:hypothetical protein
VLAGFAACRGRRPEGYPAATYRTEFLNSVGSAERQAWAGIPSAGLLLPSSRDDVHVEIDQGKIQTIPNRGPSWYGKIMS